MPNLTKIATDQERLMLQAFRAVIDDIRDNVTLNEIARLLELGQVGAVIDLLAMDPVTWAPLQEQIRASYLAGGLAGAAQIGAVSTAVGGKLVMRFNVRAPRAEEWLRRFSSERIVETAQSQREMARRVLTEQLAAGVNPRTAALDLIGRIDRRTGNRVGGFIGLTDQQAQWIKSARAELEALDERYLERKLRDKRFDAKFKRAIATGRPMPKADIDAAITQMQARAERYRGETIARTESINALRAGQEQAISQAVEQAGVLPEDIERKWDATGDGRTRPDHARMEGQKRGYGVPFTAPDGSKLMYPGDSSLGAPGSQTIQCRCRAVTRIDFAGQLRRIEGFR